MSYLTGKTRTRANWRGKLILQVQVGKDRTVADVFGRALRDVRSGLAFTNTTLWWRDARAEDLFELQHLTYGHIDVDVRLPDVGEPEADETEPAKTSKRSH